MSALAGRVADAETALAMLRGYWHEACEHGGYVCLDREQAWAVLSSGEALLSALEPPDCGCPEGEHLDVCPLNEPWRIAGDDRRPEDGHDPSKRFPEDVPR